MNQTGTFRLCTLSLLAAILLINLLSSYIRHMEAGLNCTPWPGCYGAIGQLIEPADTSIVQRALTPAQTAKQAHRAIATILVILVLVVVYQARSRLPGHGPAHFLPHLLIAVILLLSVIGPASYLKTLPAIASVNLLGGMALLALTWWLWLATGTDSTSQIATGHRLPSLLTKLALIALVAQIALGSWVSANFAGAVCRGLGDCDQLGSASLIGSFWYLRELGLDEAGRVIMNQAQQFIHVTHRTGAAITAVVLGWLGIAALRGNRVQALWGGLLLTGLGAQLLLGISAVYNHLPLLLVLGHSLVASLLLLSVMRLFLLAAAHERQAVRAPRLAADS